MFSKSIDLKKYFDIDRCVLIIILCLDTTLVNSDDVSNTMESNITVITKDGVGIQVAERDQRLSLLVMIPPKVGT